MARIVNLDVNDSGAWRRISSFDLDELQGAELENHSDALLRLASSHRIRARIVPTGETCPLMYWTREEGWRVNEVAT